jgi:hypothetical protein
MPIESAATVATALGQLARAKLREMGDGAPKLEGDARMECELLCDLHYQNVRLGLEYSKPFRVLQSTIALTASDALGTSRAKARARAIYGFVLTALGRHRTGDRELQDARAMASELRDPITAAFCAQLESVAAGWTGDVDRSLDLMKACVEIHGPWLELNEYCSDAATGNLIESIRGRPNEAWGWISRATARLKRSRPTSALFAEFVVHRACATLAGLGRTVDSDPWLAAQLETLASDQRAAGGFYRLISWGHRARFFAETGSAGPAFDALSASFDAEGYNPRFVHPAVVEYYIAVAHVRLEQCLRSPKGSRPSHIAALRKALRDLRPAARLPLAKAHSLYIEGCVAWLEGSPARSHRLFAQAEALAAQETCPWVLYGIARVRAHALRDQGKLQPARDQARIAEALARGHGSEPRARWIREEFSLPVPAAAPARASSRSSKSSRTGAPSHARQQLAALLHVIRAPGSDLRPEQQVPAVLDDLLRAVDADRGLLWFQADPESGPGLTIGRMRGGEDWSPGESWRDPLIEAVRDTGEAWPPRADVAGIVPVPSVPDSVDATRVLALPLFLRHRAGQAPGGAGADARLAAAGAEDGSGGPARGQCRARLRQHVDGRERLRGDHQQARGAEP